MLNRRNGFLFLQSGLMRCFLEQARTFIRGGARSPLLFSVLLLTGVASAVGQEVTSVFAPPAKPLIAGSRGSVWLYCMNNSSQEVSRTFETSINCTLISQSASFETVLVLNTNSSPIVATIAPGSFVKEEYLLDIPLTSSGQVTLDIRSLRNYNQVVTVVEPSSTGIPLLPQRPSTSPGTNAAPAYELGEYFGTHLSFYEPIYFIVGTYPAAEFQLSLKYKVLDFKDDWDPLTHFYFAYTQTSFWELFSKDPAFYDTSYKPSGFLYYPDVYQNDFFQLDLQLGAEHESNGRGGTLERSMNTGYLQPTATVDLPYNLQFSLQPRAWFYVYVGENNPNMDQYHGYADVRTALTWLDPNSIEKIQFATRVRIGDEGSHAGLLFDLRFNMDDLPLLRKFNPSIQLQYFTGYGQTLLQYNQTSHAFRGGICLWY
jgi:phospholipase A1/A2